MFVLKGQFLFGGGTGHDRNTSRLEKRGSADPGDEQGKEKPSFCKDFTKFSGKLTSGIWVECS
jgi:hypothetical protein